MRATILLRLAALAALTSGCRPRQAPPQPPPAPASVSVFVHANPAIEDDPKLDPDSEPLEHPPSPWWTPLPPISHESPAQADQTAIAGCIDPQRLQAADVTAVELFEAAQCFGVHRAFGQEIGVYTYLLKTHPTGPHAAGVLVALGHRYEQLEVRSKAVETYRSYLSKYPAHDDARALGQRAVCLARSLKDSATVETLLSDLERNYGRKGFVVPPELALDQLCSGLLAVAR